jgi:hypothetical protein
VVYLDLLKIYLGLVRVCLISVLSGLFTVGLWFLRGGLGFIWGWFRYYLRLV